MGQNSLITKKSKATMSNLLVEMTCRKSMSQQELRFFLIYLSKLNPFEPEKTEVTFSLDDYAEVVGVELNEKNINDTTDELLGRIVYIRPKILDENVSEEIIKVQLFKRCRMFRSKLDNKWYLNFDAHDEVKPQIFQLKGEFTSIQIWNIVNLRNFQDARMYMLLAQYRKIGERIIEIAELKKMIGIDEKAYPEYKEFARTVLKKCQKALKEKTDIAFEFKAVGRPAKAVHFTIRTNKEYKLPKFLMDKAPIEIDVPEEPKIIPWYDDIKNGQPDALQTLSGAVGNEFSREEMSEIFMMLSGMPCGKHPFGELGAKFEFLAKTYASLEVYASKQDIPHRHGYLKKIIKTELANLKAEPQPTQSQPSYDLDEYEKHDIFANINFADEE